MRVKPLLCVFVCYASAFCGAGVGIGQSLVGAQAFGAARTPLIEVRAPAAAGDLAELASLFADRDERGLFAPLPEGEIKARTALMRGVRLQGVAGLKHLIASAEAGKKGYDAVQYGARVKPGQAPTQMTLGEIYDWIKATPGQPHAIGRYQFIPPTLRRLAAELGAGRNARFTPELQDAMAMILLEDAGLSRFLDGTLSQTGFMNGLAKIWAGLPNSSGKSHYHGYAGNKAVISWTRFQNEMSRIFAG